MPDVFTPSVDGVAVQAAKERAWHYIVGRIRGRLIRRFVLGGLVVAPAVGVMFAIKATLGDLQRAAVTSRESLKPPRIASQLFYMAAAFDGLNAFLLSVSTVHLLTSLYPSIGALAWPLPFQVEGIVPLVSTVGTASAIAAEVFAARTAAVVAVVSGLGTGTVP
jgi:hypothetical protein